MTFRELFEYAQKNNISVDYFPAAELEAASFASGAVCINAKDALSETPEAKVRLAHELGHFAAGGFYNSQTPHGLKVKCEKGAERWAITELVPKEQFLELARTGYVEPWDVAQRFEVTEDFAKKAIEYYSCFYNL